PEGVSSLRAAYYAGLFQSVNTFVRLNRSAVVACCFRSGFRRNRCVAARERIVEILQDSSTPFFNLMTAHVLHALLHALRARQRSRYQ
ncbi:MULTISPECIES: hypothetical protein, partial [unclassified Stenotrophomonas]|uniref:hypothetical protein n=1 Tax=unclassified Stenotrophomonas TaxID=196198 RepID=UPI001E346AF6